MFRMLRQILDLKSFFKQLGEDYFNCIARKAEFAVYGLAYILWTAILIAVPHEYKGILASLQSTTAFFWVLRFSYLGLAVVCILMARDLFDIICSYLNQPLVDFIIAMCTKTFTAVSISIVAILTTKQKKQEKKLQQLAITDELTGLFNQRYFIESLKQETQLAIKGHYQLGLILLDIDDFKTFNDIFGHECGDQVLRGTGALLQVINKDSLIICRCGGDEFAIILPVKDLATIREIACRMKQAFERLKHEYFPKDIQNKVTLSMGMSICPEMAKNSDELLYQADMALYHAKNLGKNKIHFYQDVILQIRKGISSDHQQLIGVFKALLSTISTKDKYTVGHSERVSGYAVLIGETLNLSPKEVTILQYAGLLHDIGKIEIPKSILNRIGPLTEEEKCIIRNHPVFGENILEPLEDMDHLTDFVRHHHERFDGSGYPDGLAGNKISLGARILCVADSYDAMLSERSYGRCFTQEEAFQELQRFAGTQFDPEIVRAFITVMRLKTLQENKILA